MSTVRRAAARQKWENVTVAGFTTLQDSGLSGRPIRRRASLPALAQALGWAGILAAAFVWRAAHDANIDTSWFFIVARGMLEGKILYIDYVDPNTPIVPISLMPAVLLCRAGLDPATAIVAYVLGLIVLSFGLCVPLTRRFGLGRTGSVVFRAALLAGMCFFPGDNFSEREHLLLVLSLPYLLSAALRAAGQPASPALAIATGLLAGLGFGQKPFYLLIPAALELWLAIRRRWTPATAAPAFALAGVVAVLAAVTALCFPRYWQLIVPWARALYPAYNSPEQVRLFTLLFAPPLAILLLLRPRSSRPTAHLVELALVASVAALAGFVLQGKGWYYQAQPFVGYECLALIALLLDLRGSSLSLRQLAAGALVGLALAWVLPVNELSARAKSRAEAAALDWAVAEDPRPFLVLSTSMFPAFPLALETGRLWASRYPCLAMLPGLVRAEAEGRPSPWEPIFRHQLAEDLHRFEPHLVFLPPRNQLLPEGFDTLGWLLHDGEFTREWSHYRMDRFAGEYRVFVRERNPS